MALQPVEQYATNTQLGRPRAEARRIRPFSFAAGTGTLAYLTAVTRANATGFWQLWLAQVSEVDTITEVPTVTSGTWTITVDGQVSAAIAWNASNATILAALLAMPNVNEGDVVLTGGGATGVKTAPLVLTWGGSKAGKAFTVSVSSASLVGGTYGLAQTTAGVSTVDGTAGIRGFLWPDALTLNAGGQVIGQVMTEGTIDRNDIPLNGVSQANMDAALKGDSLRQYNLVIQGLQGA